MEWKSGRALSMTRGTVKLEHWVVGALSSHSPPAVSVPLVSMSRWIFTQESILVVWGALGPC